MTHGSIVTGDDLRKVFEKTMTELTRAGKRRPVTEWIKANYGGLAGLLKEEPDKFEMVGGGAVKLREANSDIMDASSVKPQAGTKMLCADPAEEDAGIDFAVDIV